MCGPDLGQHGASPNFPEGVGVMIGRVRIEGVTQRRDASRVI